MNFYLTDAFWLTMHSNEKVAENQRLILELVWKNNYITAIEIALEIGLSQRSAHENMPKLNEMCVLKPIGPAKGGHWESIKKYTPNKNQYTKNTESQTPNNERKPNH